MLQQTIRTENGARRSVVPRHHIRIDEKQSRVLVPANGRRADPIINLIRNGETIEAIEITCACGNHVRIDCQYGS